MEWAWMLAGIAAGAVAGVAGARWLPRAPARKAPVMLPEEWDRRFKLLAADVEDALEKMHRLHDRIRKRAKIDDEPEPANDRQFIDGPSVLRYAREKGLIK